MQNGQVIDVVKLFLRDHPEKRMPDETWKGTGTCTNTYKGGDKTSLTWEEGSHLKEYPYKITGGTGKYQGASGGGTYTLEELTDTLMGGKFKGQIVLP